MGRRRRRGRRGVGNGRSSTVGISRNSDIGVVST
jgi:hypothetical protein